MAREIIPFPTVEGAPAADMERTGKNIYIRVDGKRVAKRGAPGGRHAKTWVSLEPGYVVRDAPGETIIEVHGVRIH